MNSKDDRDLHWARSPITTRHSQASLLLVSITWGLSYMMPPWSRVPFSEVFPSTLTKWSQLPMWGWGIILFTSALFALIGERVIMENTGTGSTAWAWRLSFLSHAVLCAAYGTLATAAAVEAFSEAAQYHWIFSSLVSATSRTVLWGYIGYLHYTYARLPRPVSATPRKHKHRRRKLRWVEVEGDSA